MDDTDKKLLENAAKAAGEEFVNLLSHDRWNPLVDDAHALRLAVKLRIDLEFSDFHVEAYQRIDDTFHIASEGYAPGSEAATRRAIVRAAASLAK